MPGSTHAEHFQRINTRNWFFHSLEADLDTFSGWSAGGRRRMRRLPSDSNSTLAIVVHGSRQNRSPAPPVFAPNRQVKPTPPRANAASMGIPDKQESHRVRCVHNDAGGFPERSTQPMVGSRNVRRTCQHRCDGVQENPVLLDNPARPDNALHLHEQRSSLTSGHLYLSFPQKAKAQPEYTPNNHPRQATIAKVTRRSLRFFGVMLCGGTFRCRWRKTECLCCFRRRG